MEEDKTVQVSVDPSKLPVLTPSGKGGNNRVRTDSGKKGSSNSSEMFHKSEMVCLQLALASCATRNGIGVLRAGTTTEVSNGSGQSRSTTEGRIIRCADTSGECAVLFDNSEGNKVGKRHFSSLRSIEQVKTKTVSRRW